MTITAKKALVRRAADAMEKLAIGSMLVGPFQNKLTGIAIGLAGMGVSYALTVWKAKL